MVLHFWRLFVLATIRVTRIVQRQLAMGNAQVARIGTTHS